MTTPTPDLIFGKVVGRFVEVFPDSVDDPDRNPDDLGATGTITFTAVRPFRNAAGTEPVTALVRSVVCGIDDNGYLVDPDGGIGVWLVIGAYRVDYQFGEFTLPYHLIEVLPTHEDAAPLDLTKAAFAAGL